MGLANKNASKKNMTVREAALVMNEASLLAQSVLQRRADFFGAQADPRKDIDKECGYLENPTVLHYGEMYERSGLAARVVNLLPNECWAVDPEVYETERPRDTPFEKGWKDLVAHPTLNPNYYMHKIDALSRVGRFGGLLFGFDDAKPPDTIVDGMSEDGTFDAVNSVQKPRRLLYLRSLDESRIKVYTTQNDPFHPRYGMPQLYQIRFVEETTQGITKIEDRKVHWSRILHVAETEGASELFAAPAQAKVFDQLLDVRKILGGSAEMFWKGGFPGIAATVDPRFIEAGGIDIDEQSISDEMQRYIEGLQRSILGVGFQINSLAPQVADPASHLMMQWTMIAMSIGIPVRVFMGSEQAKLASGQDIKAWNKRLQRRQNKYLTPRLIRPFVQRLIATGVVPPTKVVDPFGLPVFNVFWPDVSMPDENERSAIADRRAAALMKFVTSKTYQMMQPSDFLRFVLGFTVTEVEQIMDNAHLPPEIEFEEPLPPDPTETGGFGKKKPGAADSGSKGTAPSNNAPRSAPGSPVATK